MKPSTDNGSKVLAIKRRTFFGKLSLSIIGGLAGSSVLGGLFAFRKGKDDSPIVIAHHELSVPRRKKG